MLKQKNQLQFQHRFPQSFNCLCKIAERRTRDAEGRTRNAERRTQKAERNLRCFLRSAFCSSAFPRNSAKIHRFHLSFYPNYRNENFSSKNCMKTCKRSRNKLMLKLISRFFQQCNRLFYL
jgi:hypothetical protein